MRVRFEKKSRGTLPGVVSKSVFGCAHAQRTNYRAVSIDPLDKHGFVVPSSVGLVSKVVGRAFARTRQLCGHSIKPMSFHACELTILAREGVWG